MQEKAFLTEGLMRFISAEFSIITSEDGLFFWLYLPISYAKW
jgi:hypothetical protein